MPHNPHPWSRGIEARASTAVTLFQLSRSVPETLSLARLSEDAIDRVLTQNGLHLGFHLPHAYQTAQFRAPQRETLERLLTTPEIAALALTDIE